MGTSGIGKSTIFNILMDVGCQLNDLDFSICISDNEQHQHSKVNNMVSETKIPIIGVSKQKQIIIDCQGSYDQSI